MGDRMTLGELQARVERALADGYETPANGQVREVPDARTIRWYQTVGLVDRPRYDGRVAIYDRRHLLQIVAVKRLQSQGTKLRDVQARLLGLDDRALARIARVDPAVLASPVHAESVHAESVHAESVRTPHPSSTAEGTRAASRRDGAFWGTRGSREPPLGTGHEERSRELPPEPVVERTTDEAAQKDAARPVVATQVALTVDELTISFTPSRALDDDDLAAIASSLATLNDTLLQRGIVLRAKKGSRA